MSQHIQIQIQIFIFRTFYIQIWHSCILLTGQRRRSANKYSFDESQHIKIPHVHITPVTLAREDTIHVTIVRNSTNHGHCRRYSIFGIYCFELNSYRSMGRRHPVRQSSHRHISLILFRILVMIEHRTCPLRPTLVIHSIRMLILF